MVLKVKGASLDDHIAAQNLSNNTPFILAEIYKKVKNNETIDYTRIVDDFMSDKMLHNTMFELSLFQRNVLKPKFTYEEVLDISEKIPEFINSVVKFSLGLTDNYAS